MINKIKKYLKVVFISIFFVSSPSLLFAGSEAGALFLLISPGARAGGMGEAQVLSLIHI